MRDRQRRAWRESGALAREGGRDGRASEGNDDDNQNQACRRGIFRIGSVAGIVGALLAMVGNLLHPATPIGDPEGVARTIAQSETWVLVHLVIVVGLILMLGALVALSRSIERGLAGALAQLGLVAAVAGVTVGLVLVIVDGVAAKHLADAWEAAPPEEAATALRVVLAEEAINFALAALFNILFAGVTFILLGVAVAWRELERTTPRRNYSSVTSSRTRPRGRWL